MGNLLSQAESNNIFLAADMQLEQDVDSQALPRELLTWAALTSREQCKGAWMEGPPDAGLMGSHVMWPCCCSISLITGLSRITSLLDSLNPLGLMNSIPPRMAITGRYMPAKTSNQAQKVALLAISDYE